MLFGFEALDIPGDVDLKELSEDESHVEQTNMRFKRMEQNP